MQKQLYFHILTVSNLCVCVCVDNLYTEEWKMITEKS